MDVLGFEERGIQCLSAKKSLDSSFRWNDEREFMAVEDP